MSLFRPFPHLTSSLHVSFLLRSRSDPGPHLVAPTQTDRKTDDILGSESSSRLPEERVTLPFSFVDGGHDLRSERVVRRWTGSPPVPLSWSNPN